MTPVVEELEEKNNEVLNLKDVIEAHEKIKGIKNLRLLPKSKFYYAPNSTDETDIREHVASYKDFAIFLKSNKLRVEDKKMVELFPSLVKLSDLKLLKKVNGNVVRKMQPNTLSVYEAMPMIQSVVTKIDNLDF